MKLNPNGEFEVEQMYVQHVRLAAPKARYSMLMMDRHSDPIAGLVQQ